jgi:bifunctional DNA-binding transcriptional regulator/antitoxin component of YhaV-PrlF toxin-antitoxin module
MTVLVKNKPSLTIPQAIAKKAGFKPGDLIEFKVNRGTVTVRTTTFPTADDEYTPAQRRVLDASLAEADKGPYFGPFKSGTEVAAFMKKRQQTAKPTKLKKSR